MLCQENAFPCTVLKSSCVMKDNVKNLVGFYSKQEYNMKS